MSRVSVSRLDQRFCGTADELVRCRENNSASSEDGRPLARERRETETNRPSQDCLPCSQVSQVYVSGYGEAAQGLGLKSRHSGVHQ